MYTDIRPARINFHQYDIFLRNSKIVYANYNASNIVNISIDMFADLEDRLQRSIGTLHKHCPHTICLYSFYTFSTIAQSLNMYKN